MEMGHGVDGVGGGETQTGGGMEKQEAVMSVAPENGGEGTAAGPRPELCSPR